MKILKNNLYTETGWEVFENHFNEDHIITTGSNFLIGNGYLGYRGTFSEWEADRYTACIVADTYDQVAPDLRKELCNVPNALFTRLTVDGETLDMHPRDEQAKYRRGLVLRDGRYIREQAIPTEQGTLHLKVEKFASIANVHLIAMRYELRADADIQFTLETGIDGRLWSLQGEHFRTSESSVDDGVLVMENITVEDGIKVVVAENTLLSGEYPEEIIEEDKRILRRFAIKLAAGETLTLEKTVAIYHSNDLAKPRKAALRLAQEASYESAKTVNAAAWEAIWTQSDIQIDGDLEVQLLTRFNLYHNIIATPHHAPLPIGARGLATQVYQGAAFWDQEIFNLPMFTYTQPEIAKNILRYRHETLDGARGKAARLGFQGAFYAWTSGKTGKELFPDFFFTDLTTGRKVRNHFNDWQIHVSPDIVYALWQYYQASNDWDFIVQHGAEIAFEVAQFLVSRACYRKDKDTYEFHRLLGPDEYHENVDNNAYNNYLAYFAIDIALTIFREMEAKNKATLDGLIQSLQLTQADVDNWADLHAKLVLPEPHATSGLLEQFDGFFDLEDVPLTTLRERLIDPDEYWGYPNGIAVHAQALKQADVVQLFALYPDLFSQEQMRANFDYYEPRTEHGSSLSPSAHGLVASMVGYEEKAYEYFFEASTIDLYNMSRKVLSGGEFLGGIHTAACGGVWQMLIFGFVGFHPKDGILRFNPALPKAWTQMRFPFAFRQNRFKITLSTTALEIEAARENTASIPVQIGEEEKPLSAGETIKFKI